MTDLAVNLGGLQLEHPIINAAGTCKNPSDAESHFASALAAVVIGSGTKEARAGNEGKTFEQDEHRSVNSLGLPNPGLEGYRAAMPALLARARASGKPLIFSASGFSPDENAELAVEMLVAGADAIEVNLACPNIWAGGQQKGLACYNPRTIERIISAIAYRLYVARRDGFALPTDPVIGYKITYCPDPGLRGEVAAVLMESQPRLKFLTAINTLGASKWLDANGKPQITATDGMGGMGGPHIKPQGIGMVVEFRKLLSDDIAIIGVGGVSCTQDVVDYLNHGAKAVGMATHLMRPDGLRDVGKMLDELTDRIGAS